MTDHRSPLDALDRLNAPDLWTDISRRTPAPAEPPAPSRRYRVGVVLLALFVAGAGFALLVHAFQTTTVPGGSTKTNGPLTFVETSRPGRGPWHIETMAASGGAVRDLTPAGNNFADLAWSPDGTQIAFSEFHRAISTIHVMDANGSNQRQLVSCEPPGCVSASSPTWSPDGSTIAYVRAPGSFGTATDAILTVDVRTGAIRFLAGLPRLNYAMDLAWSPDGRSIAFAASPQGPGKVFSIYVVGADGTGLHRLTGGDGSQNVDPRWSPDGSRIVFVRDPDLYVMSADGSGARQLLSCRPACDSAYEPAWSPDGHLIAFSEQFGNQRDLFVVSADGTGVRRLTDTPADEFDPQWQPVIGFTPQPTATSPELVQGLSGEVAYKCGDTICLMRPDGSGVRELTGKSASAPFPQWDPAWSPDGRRIAFRGYYGLGDGQYDLYVVDASGCNLVRLTHGLNGTNPSWSPNGSQIAFSVGGIDLISPRGTGLRHLTRDTSAWVDDAPSWSTSDRIAFVRYPARNALGLHFGEIYAMNADGTAVTPLTRGAPGFGEPSWSPDGGKLAFVSYPGSSAVIDVMNADGTGIHTVSPPSWKSSGPTWTPDGRVVFLVERGPQTTAYIVNADGSGLRPLYPTLDALQVAWGASSLANGRC